jgi:hypothetical protein
VDYPQAIKDAFALGDAKLDEKINARGTPHDDMVTLFLLLQAGFDSLRGGLLLISRQIEEVAGRETP